jgi:amino acid transporter
MSKTKKINLINSVAFAVGAMIGGGVFVLSGVALKQTGPSALISFLIAGVVVLLSALSFAVIASSSDNKEGGYSYIGEILGHPIWGFLTSWCFYLGGIIGAAFVLNAFGTYLHEFLFSQLSIIYLAIMGAIALTLVNLGPASEIGKIETFLVGGKLIILCLLIVFGLIHFHSSDLTPFSPHGTKQIFITSAFLFIAFLGFNVITSISGDIDNPKKTVPRAILLSMLIVTVVYAGIVIALLAGHINNYDEASVGVAAKHLIGPIGGGLIVIGALVSTLSSANANILGTSEIMVRLAGKKQVPSILGKMTNGHPYVSVLTGAVIYFILIVSNQTSLVIGLANTIAIIALIIVNASAAKKLKDEQYSGMKLPLGSLIPYLAIIGALSQFLFMKLGTTILGLALILVGVIVYSLRNRYHVPDIHKDILSVIEAKQSPLTRTLRR